MPKWCSKKHKTVKCPQLQRYVEQINKAFAEIKVKIEDITDNSTTREYTRIVMNSLLGKLSQNSSERMRTMPIKDAEKTIKMQVE